MALNTKLNLVDAKFYQQVDGTLSLSGHTRIASSGDLKYNVHPNFTGATQIVDKQYVDYKVVSGVTGGTIYAAPLLSPAAVCVGGIPIGYVPLGKTSNQILQDMLFPELFGALNPINGATLSLTPSVSLSPAAGTYEVGCSMPTVTITGTFNRGTINPQYCSACSQRSGPVTTHYFSGPQTSGSKACTTLSPTTATTSSYVVTAGANTAWSVCVATSVGTQPRSNKNNTFSSPLPANTSSAGTAAYTGIYPYYYGKSVGVPTPNTALIATGTKVVADSAGQINLTFGADTDKYLWFATPCESTTKLGWRESVSNGGNIGSGSDLFGAATSVNVDSPQSCWATKCYKIYVSNYSTAPTANAYCITNTAQQ